MGILSWSLRGVRDVEREMSQKLCLALKFIQRTTELLTTQVSHYSFLNEQALLYIFYIGRKAFTFLTSVHENYEKKSRFV